MTPDQIDAFLDEPRVAQLATVFSDGAPHVTPVWFYHDAGKVMLIARATTIKVRNMRRDPRIMLSIATHDQPYAYVLVRGEAVISDDGGDDLFRRMAVHYKQDAEEGLRYAERILSEKSFLKVTVTPSKITGWTEEEE